LADRYQRFALLGAVDRVEVVEATPDGRALRVTVVDDEGESADLDAESFRLTVDPTGRMLQSTYFKITVEPDNILFASERGMGHGMGLCQYGAEYMAQVGRSVTAILRHYYPSSHVTRAY
jgi:stage II sporulation protein D